MSNRASSLNMGSPRRPKRSNADMGYDSNKKPPKEERLHWKMDPEESLSDWTIEILVGGKTHGTYHVHKSILAIGDRKSEYFVRLFRSGNHRFAEAADSTSSIELHPLAAITFPLFLNYLYSGELDISTETSMGLRNLAGYFENRSLRWETKLYIRHIFLTIETAGTYYEQSQIFHDDKIQSAVVDLCVRHIAEISPNHSIVVDPSITPQLWLDILQKAQEVQPQQPEDSISISRHLSNLVANFCRTHRDTIDGMTFQELTSETCLPHIDCHAALPLMDLERRLLSVEPTTKPAVSSGFNNNNLAHHQSTTTNLQQRSLASLHGNWATVDISQSEELQDLVRHQHPQVLLSLFLIAQSNAVELTRELDKAKED